MGGIRHQAGRPPDQLYSLPPLVNWCFQRDPQVVVGDGVVFAAMATAAVSSVPETSGPRAQIQDRQQRHRSIQAQVPSSSPGPLASQDQNLTLSSAAGEGLKETEKEITTPTPAPATAPPAKGMPSNCSESDFVRMSYRS